MTPAQLTAAARRRRVKTEQDMKLLAGREAPNWGDQVYQRSAPSGVTEQEHRHATRRRSHITHRSPAIRYAPDEWKVFSSRHIARPPTWDDRGVHVAAQVIDDDAAVLARLRAGDEEAFLQLVERHSSSMLHIARRYVPSQAVAEEVVQETWLGVLTGLERFEGRSPLKSWLFRILVNRARTRGTCERRTIPFAALAGREASEAGPTVDPERFVRADYRRGHWMLSRALGRVAQAVPAVAGAPGRRTGRGRAATAGAAPGHHDARPRGLAGPGRARGAADLGDEPARAACTVPAIRSWRRSRRTSPAHLSTSLRVVRRVGRARIRWYRRRSRPLGVLLALARRASIWESRGQEQDVPASQSSLDDVSQAIIEIYRPTHDLTRTGVSTHMAKDILICVLEDVGALAEQAEVGADRVLDQRRRFQREHEVDFCAAVEELTGRRVRTFLSANHVTQGVAAEVFFLMPAEPD
jgi:RNA polymerase sigma-70 factor (ECF subfamily)